MHIYAVKYGNDHIKQPKLLSPDASSELEVCQNAFAAGAVPGPHSGEAIHVLLTPSSGVPCRRPKSRPIALLVGRTYSWRAVWLAKLFL